MPPAICQRFPSKKLSRGAICAATGGDAPHRYGGDTGDQEVGVLVRVESGDPAGSLGALLKSGAAPGADPSAGATEGECRVAGAVARLDGLGRWVLPGAGTAAAGGWVVSSAGGLGAAPVGSGKTADGSGDGIDTAGCVGEETADGITGGADTAGTGTVTGMGAPEPLCAVMTTTIAPPARARPPPASASLFQRRRSVARDRKSSHGSVSASCEAAVGGLGASVGAAPVVAHGGGVSTPARSRNERNSSIAKIWSASDSSTT
jgi:hypothetical protein